MKFIKEMAGWYRTEDYMYKIDNFSGYWKVTKRVEGKHRGEYVAFPITLKEAKAFCEKDAQK